MTGAGIVALLFREIKEEGRKTLRPCPDKKRGHELLMASKAYFGWCLVGGLVGSGSLSGLFSRSCGNRGSGSGRFWGILQTDVKNGGFLRFVGAGHVIVAQGRDDEQYRHCLLYTSLFGLHRVTPAEVVHASHAVGVGAYGHSVADAFIHRVRPHPVRCV